MPNRLRPKFRTIHADVLLAGSLAGLTVVTLAAQTPGSPTWPAVTLAVLSVAPVAVRQRWPLLTAAAILGALTCYSVLGYGDFPNGAIGMVIAMFTVATLRSRRAAAAVYAGGVGVTVIAYREMSSTIAWSLAVQAGLVLLAAWALGESTRRWARRAERAAAEAAQAVAAERVRIARELHDVVAHHMSVVAVQAGLASYVLEQDLPTARSAIAAAGDGARDALQDMRRMLDALRVDDEGPGYGPQPGLGELDGLVERMLSAGLRVEVVRSGRRRPLPPGPDLCAYRVAQESLTNVLKHAGPASVRLELTYGENTLVLAVRDDGRPVPSAAVAGSGYGLRGMRERAELYGGVLEAGPQAGGGFAVVLRLPLVAALSEGAA